MKLTRRDGLKLMGATAIATTAPMAALAESHGGNVVKMLNKNDAGDRQVFDPPVIMIEEGASVLFEATDRGHNSEANDDLLPEGGEAWSGKINEDIEVTFNAPGVYGYYCTPHQSAGMIGLVLVGNVTQEMLDAAGEVRQRGKARGRMEDYLAMASEMIAAS